MSMLKKIFCAGLLATFMSLCSVSQAYVLDGAKEWNGHYYKVFQIKMNWEQAEKFCQSVGGHLATAETVSENDVLKELVSREGTGCWIGGYSKNNIWRWVTGKIISDYFDWIESPPSGDDRRITMIGSREISKCKWTWSWNSYEKIFICEWESRDLAHDSTM